jgi:hypothetical protein
MIVIPLSRARGIAADVASLPLPAEWADPRHFATNAAGIVHDVTARLLGALTKTIASAGPGASTTPVHEEQPKPCVTRGSRSISP